MTSYVPTLKQYLSVPCPTCGAAVNVECETPRSGLLTWRDVRGDLATQAGVHGGRGALAIEASLGRMQIERSKVDGAPARYALFHRLAGDGGWSPGDWIDSGIRGDSEDEVRGAWRARPATEREWQETEVRLLPADSPPPPPPPPDDDEDLVPAIEAPSEHEQRANAAADAPSGLESGAALAERGVPRTRAGVLMAMFDARPRPPSTDDGDEPAPEGEGFPTDEIAERCGVNALMWADAFLAANASTSATKPLLAGWFALAIQRALDLARRVAGGEPRKPPMTAADAIALADLAYPGTRPLGPLCEHNRYKSRCVDCGAEPMNATFVVATEAPAREADEAEIRRLRSFTSELEAEVEAGTARSRAATQALEDVWRAAGLGVWRDTAAARAQLVESVGSMRRALGLVNQPTAAPLEQTAAADLPTYPLPTGESASFEAATPRPDAGRMRSSSPLANAPFAAARLMAEREAANRPNGALSLLAHARPPIGSGASLSHAEVTYALGVADTTSNADILRLIRWLATPDGTAPPSSGSIILTGPEADAFRAFQRSAIALEDAHRAFVGSEKEHTTAMAHLARAAAAAGRAAEPAVKPAEPQR